jgi:hypothetical protein
MSLSDIMSAAGLTGWAVAGLVLCLLAFSAVAVWTVLRPRSEMEACARSALDDGAVAAAPVAPGGDVDRERRSEA